MKTLVEILNAQLPISPPVDATTRAEIVAGLVGAVQGWLIIGMVVAIERGGDLVCVSELVREAGRGLSDVSTP